MGIRQRREEAARKKAEEAAKAGAKAKKEEAKEAVNEKQRAVAEQVAKLVLAFKDSKMTLNQLLQDAGCKKVLKPLQKKEGIKAINKAWLEKYPDLLELKEEGKELMIYPKSK